MWIEQAYSLALTTDWAPPVRYELVSGTLPKCLSISPGGLITGRPMSVGTFTFVVRATNAAGAMVLHPITLTVTSASIGPAGPVVPPVPPVVGWMDGGGWAQ